MNAAIGVLLIIVGAVLIFVGWGIDSLLLSLLVIAVGGALAGIGVGTVVNNS